MTVEVKDRDLISIQEARNLVAAAAVAQESYARLDQAVVDRAVEAVSRACEAQAERLARLANEETGFGRWEDKTLKNLFASRDVYRHIKDLKTVGIIKEDAANRIFEVGVPVGLVTALIPSTNPTSTTIFKALIALKAGCAVIFSPHPAAKNCILETVQLIRQTLEAIKLPADLVTSLTMPTKQGTDTLMRHPRMNLILATGGNAMVHAAYSSGTPAIGVGPGNGPAYIEKSADIPLAVKRIFDSKTFDNGTICASEQSVVTETSIRKEVMEEISRQGGYFLPPGDSERVERILMGPGGTMNAQLVGRPAERIAQAAGITIPPGTKILLGQETRVGEKYPYSREKLMPVLGFFVEDNWEKACLKCIEILSLEGAGHTMTIHSRDEAVIREFGLKKPVSRLIVNAPAALAAIGATTALAPSLTLGCGAIGHNSTSDNVGPLNLINIRRVAYGLRELDDLRPGGGPPGQNQAQPSLAQSGQAQPGQTVLAAPDPAFNELVRLVMERLTLSR
ncbi:MAG: acetaldehyde dehydrogenase (acetylating) [Deltaproteobacteria bacterium]|jgi:acetaldehyde dehydrogenase (acetylating)|nr:acetaldehyde dehydrogenase (acetylating) [Deltaproteobacteria bacterium]